MSDLLPPRFNLQTHISYVQTPEKRYMTISYLDDGQPHVKARCLIELICDWTIADWVLDTGFNTGREEDEIPWPTVIAAMKEANLDDLIFEVHKRKAEIDVLEYVPWVVAEAEAESSQQVVDAAIEGLTLDMVLSTPAAYLTQIDVYRAIPDNAVQFPVNFEFCKESFFKG